MWKQPTTTTLRIVVTIFAGFAQLITTFRLSYRYRRRLLGWDDAWAAVSLVCSLMLLIGLWIRTDTPGLGPIGQSLHSRIAAYWVVTLSFTNVLWSARMSILFSIIKIIPPMMGLRRTAYFFAVLFTMFWASLIAQKVYICAHDTSWQQSAKPQCHLGHDVAVLELTTDFISDLVLVVIPIRLLWDINLPMQQRKLLFIIFSASILTTVVSIVHAVYLLGPSGLLEALTANVEAAVSLIVANLAVVVTYVYRMLRHGSDTSETPFDYTQESEGNGIGLNKVSKRHNRFQVTTLRFAKASRAGEVSSTDTLDGPSTTTNPHHRSSMLLPPGSEEDGLGAPSEGSHSVSRGTSPTSNLSRRVEVEA